MPIQSPDDAHDVEQRVDEFFDAAPEARPDLLRALFAEVLDFDRVAGQLSLDAASNVTLPPSAERIAQLDGVHALYLTLGGQRVNKRDVVAAANIVRSELGEDMLLLCANADASQLHWIHPSWGAQNNPTLRRMVIERDLPRRTAVQQVANLFHDHQQRGNLLDAINAAFDVEPVTKAFFRAYERIHQQALESVSGFDDPEETKQFVQTLLNRLMFVYFLSRKGWLSYDGDTDYLNALWHAYQEHPRHANFYNDRLSYVFFQGLNNPDSRDLRGGVDYLIGEVPFLNGGLFEESELDQRDGIVAPDAIFESLLTKLFDAFNFTVMESTPFDIEVAVDPEMLGKVFEELVTGRHDSGAYYTPRPVVSFMCREALKGYLESALSPQEDENSPLSLRERVRVRASDAPTPFSPRPAGGDAAGRGGFSAHADAPTPLSPRPAGGDAAGRGGFSAHADAPTPLSPRAAGGDAAGRGGISAHADAPTPLSPRAAGGDAAGRGGISAFVDDRDASGLSLADARAILAALSAVTVVDPACGSGAYLVGMMQELIELQDLLYSAQLQHDAKSLYDLKLQIIERNLYGVDLDPFAVNIAMLRLWLSLAIDFDGDQPEPLPNLDFKILQGDSLLGPDPSGFSQHTYLVNQSDLAQLKATFLTETSPTGKQRLREQIERARSQLRDSLGDTVAEDALDWRVEFAEVFANGGFDIAIANPPYVQLQSNAGRLGKRYQDCGYQTFARTGDLYQLFYERGCQVLRNHGGLVAYITSNSWLRAQYGKKSRKFFSEQHQPLRWLDLGKDVFETAIVDSGILLLRTGAPAAPFPSVDMDALPGVHFPPPADQWGETRPNGDAPWSVLSPLEWSVMEKMQRIGTPLKDWDVKINRGILTGYNAAFIIDTPTRDRLVAEDPRSAEIIKPVLRGRDIRRYRADWQGLWLITTFPPLSLDIDDYPAVKRHLLTFGKQRLEQSGKRLTGGARARKKTGNAWFEMQDTCAYYADFDKPKLYWLDLTERGRFAYSDSEVFCLNTASMLVGPSVKYLCAVLNGHLISWFIRDTALNSGMGTPRWIKSTVERIPIPELSEEMQMPFVEFVDRILDAKDADPDADTSHWEREIDTLVYQLYGLTDAEIAAVERRVGG